MKHLSVTNQKNAIVQYCHVVLFSMLYKVVLTFKFVDKTIMCDHSGESYFDAVMLIMLYKMVLTFKSVDETLVCDHSNESHYAKLSCGTVYVHK